MIIRKLLVWLLLTTIPIIGSAGIEDYFGADLEASYYQFEKQDNDLSSEDSVNVYRANLRFNTYIGNYSLLKIDYGVAKNSLAKNDKRDYINDFNKANILVGNESLNLKIGRMHYNEKKGGDYLIYYGTHSITQSPFITYIDGGELNAKYKILTLNAVYGIDENEYYDNIKTDAKISGGKIGFNIKEQIKINGFIYTKEEKVGSINKNVYTPGIEFEYNGEKNNLIFSYAVSSGKRKSTTNEKDYDGDALIIKYSYLREADVFDTKFRFMYANGSGDKSQTTKTIESFESINSHLEMGEVFLNRDSLKNSEYLRTASSTYGLQANDLKNLKVENIGMDLSTKYIKGFMFSADVFNFNLDESVDYLTPSTELGQELNLSLKYFYKDFCLRLFYAKFKDGEAMKAAYSPNVGSVIKKQGITLTYNFN